MLQPMNLLTTWYAQLSNLLTLSSDMLFVSQDDVPLTSVNMPK